VTAFRSTPHACVAISISFSFFLSFFLSLNSSTYSIQCMRRGLLLHLIPLNDTHSVGLPLDEGSARLQKTYLRRYSSPPSQQASGRRPAPLTARPPGPVISISRDIKNLTFTTVMITDLMPLVSKMYRDVKV
jgi:hypothetical protein